MIKAHILDAAALAARTPAELSSYLRASGWRLAQQNSLVAFWTLPVDNDELEILQPLDSGLRDYALRMGDAIVALAAAEDRSELDVLQRIATASWDVLRSASGAPTRRGA